MSYTLISDIGGTNIRISLKGEGISYEDFVQSYKCKDFKNIEYALLKYLETIDQKYFPSSALLAVAAPVSSNYVEFANNHWRFFIDELEQKTGIKNIKVINDFEAQAYCLEFLTKNDVCLLKKATHNKQNGRKLILGPGTGLGVSLLVENEGKWNVLSTEAGHIIIGTNSKLEQDILNILYETYGKESFAELVISGYGIVNIYQSLCKLNNINFNKNYNARKIVELALQSANKNCMHNKAVEIFFSFFGSFISSMAVAFLPYNGIYITGGIIPKLINQIQESVFVTKYQERALQGVLEIIESIDIYVITKENPALLGLAYRNY